MLVAPTKIARVFVIVLYLSLPYQIGTLIPVTHHTLADSPLFRFRLSRSLLSLSYFLL